jgi:uncharacterized RDD family membrane protein YckC
MSYANWGHRVGGYVIDSLLVLPFSILAMALDGPTVNADGTASGSGALYWILTLAGIAVFGYNRWFLAGTTGQSWGRKALGTRLVAEATGQPIGVGKAFARDIAHLFDTLICYIGWLFPIWDAKRQTISDKIVKTVVVKL